MTVQDIGNNRSSDPLDKISATWPTLSQRADTAATRIQAHIEQLPPHLTLAPESLSESLTAALLRNEAWPQGDERVLVVAWLATYVPRDVLLEAAALLPPSSIDYESLTDEQLERIAAGEDFREVLGGTVK